MHHVNMIPTGHPLPRSATIRFLLGWGVLSLASQVSAQSLGISSQGNSGGLTIPWAYVLDTGSLSLTYGSYREPTIPANARRVNTSLGIGLFPNVELFGRITDYTQPGVGGALDTGQRDLSANMKVQIPLPWKNAPKLAVGLNDIGGGAVNFGASYLVASDEWGPLLWTAGYASGKAVGGVGSNQFAMSGRFGGLDLRLGRTGFSAMVEHDGRQKHAGLRYASSPLPILGGAQLIGTVHRSFDAQNLIGTDVDATNFSMSLVVPLGSDPSKARNAQPQGYRALPALNPAAPSGLPADRLAALQKALESSGLERVRVGRVSPSGIHSLVVEYENHRYGQNEADALGIVLGLAAEYAPAGTPQLQVVTLKAGQAVHITKADVAAYRQFLRDGDAGIVRSTLVQLAQPDFPSDTVNWLNSSPGPRSLARVEVKPDLSYAVATEVGLVDYTLAANVQAMVPLWPGAEFYTSFISAPTVSKNYEVGEILAGSRQREGFKVAALVQSFWVGKHIYAHIGLGQFNYDDVGWQTDATVFVPGRDDTVRFKGAYYQRPGSFNANRAQPVSASYRYVYNPATWLEAGVQQYSDGSRGPSIVLTRWFGDVSVNLFYRRGDLAQFAGIELSIPLTPRQGMAPGALNLTGTSHFQRGLRTRITDSSTAQNLVQPNAVRDFQMDYNAEVQQLNAGRRGTAYLGTQMGRMRDAFFKYARPLLPE
jgi:hypothetical protein